MEQLARKKYVHEQLGYEPDAKKPLGPGAMTLRKPNGNGEPKRSSNGGDSDVRSKSHFPYSTLVRPVSGPVGGRLCHRGTGAGG